MKLFKNNNYVVFYQVKGQISIVNLLWKDTFKNNKKQKNLE